MVERRAFLLLFTLGLLAPAGLTARADDGGRAGAAGSGGGNANGGGNGSGGGNGGRAGGGSGNGNGGGNGNGNGYGRATGSSGRGAGGPDSVPSDNNDDDRIRSAVRRGEAEPLRKILAVVRQRYDGKVVRISLAGQGSGLHYRIRILGTDNSLIEVRVSAKTASILGAAGI